MCLPLNGSLQCSSTDEDSYCHDDHMFGLVLAIILPWVMLPY